LMAYNITVRQISGQDPLLSERYDIAAKAEHAVSRDQMLRMLQALLVERFKLVVHRETREVPVYALSVGRGGPKLHRSDLSRGEVINPRTPSGAGGTELKSGHLIFRDESMSDFAWALSRMVATGDRVVLDNTGLNGTYDFEVIFEPSRTLPGAELPGTATSIEVPSIFEAVQEQLGLKLESKKGPVEFLIIEQVERPSAN
jgi:bla regulator protein BlaR1